MAASNPKPGGLILGRTAAGENVPALVEADGTWAVKFDPSNMSAFGTLETAPLTPVVQLDFVYGVNTQTGLATMVNSATTDTNGGRLRLQSGTNSAGSAIFNSRRIAKYRPGEGMVARFTAAFTTGVASSTQIVGPGNAIDGYFVGYNGTAFGLCHRINGSDNWVAQTAWNGDKCNGTGASAFTINPTFGNVYMIKYPFLGYGDIGLYIQDSVTSRWILAHTIRYTNTTTTVQLTNPSLFFYAQSLNAGATTNQIVYVGSVGIFISGERSFASSPTWATDNQKTGITTETNILTLRNATTYNGLANRALMRLQSLTVGASGTSTPTSVVRMKVGATLGGSPSYTPISGNTSDAGVTITSGNSIASVDVAGTTVTNGTLIFNAVIVQNSSYVVDLTDFNIYLAPGETLTFSGTATATAAITVGVNWAEDI